MKKLIVVFVILLVCSFGFANPVKENISAGQTMVFTDSCNRTVEIPTDITRVSPSGTVATLFLTSIAPEYMCNVDSALSEEALKYLPSEIAALPATGQLYGSKAKMSPEEILACGADIIIDMGTYKSGIEDDLNDLQAKVGIPCIFIEASLENMADAFRTLGSILSGKKDRGEEIASFIDETLQMVKTNSAKVKADEVVSVMYGGNSDGLGVTPKGSPHAQVIDLIGAENAIVLDSISNKANANLIDLEALYNFNPDVLLFIPDSFYDNVASAKAWQVLDAVKNKRYYQAPAYPYNWMSNPPSMNMILGLWWFGNLIYPQYYDYDMVQVAQRAFKIFWNYELSETEALELMGK